MSRKIDILHKEKVTSLERTVKNLHKLVTLAVFQPEIVVRFIFIKLDGLVFGYSQKNCTC